MNATYNRAEKSGGVVVEGAALRYLVEGHGTPTLVFGSTIYYPRTFSPQLHEQLRLIHLDARHFVPSDPSFNISQITIDTYARDIEQVRQSLGLGRVVVMGHSIHGTVALEYARRYPQHVSGVIALGAVPRGMGDVITASGQVWQADASEERKVTLQRKLAELTPDLLGRLSPGDVLIQTYVANGPKYWYDLDYDALWLWEDVTPNMPILNHLYGQLFAAYDLAQGPGQITMPVLVIHGRFDYSAPYTLWEAHKSKLTQLTYHLFDKSGHTPQLEESERFNHIVVEWVEGLERQR